MSFRISRLGGITVNADTTNYHAPSIHALYTASTAVDVGQVVGLATGNLAGKLVIPCAAGRPWSICGIYEGEGGTGGVTANVKITSGATAFSADQKKAVANDLIYVKTYGVAYALTDGDTGDANDGSTLTISATTAGLLISAVSTPTASSASGPRITCLETITTNATTTAVRVFIQG